MGGGLVRETGDPEAAVEVSDGVERCCEVLNATEDADVGVQGVETCYGVSLVREVLDGVEEVSRTAEKRLFQGVLGLHYWRSNLRE